MRNDEKQVFFVAKEGLLDRNDGGKLICLFHCYVRPFYALFPITPTYGSSKDSAKNY